MAAPTFNETGYMTLIANADTVQWPPSTEVDADIKVEGGGSNLDAIRNGGTFTFTFGASQDMSTTNTMVRVWFMHTFPSYLQTKANGGLQIGLTGGGNTGYWYVSGSDQHKGSWELLQCDPSSAVDSGTAPTLSAITEMEIVMVHATSARNLDNTYIDISWYGIGIEFYGGTTVDKVSWNTIANADTGLTTSKQYGILEWIRQGAYYLNHAIFIGDSIGTNNTYFDGSSETIVFYAANEKSGSYQIVGTGNGTGTTDIDLSACTMLSASTPFIFDMSSANLTTLSMLGASLTNSSSCLFKTGQIISSVTFTDCTSVIPDGATLDGCNFNDSLVETPVLSVLNKCSFNSSGTGHAVDLGIFSSTQSMTWDNVDDGYTAASSGNETILVSVNTGVTLTINVAATGSTPSVYNTGAGTVNVVAGLKTFTFSLSPAITGYEWRLYSVTAVGSLAGASELDGEESATAGSKSYSYSYTVDQPVAVQIISQPNNDYVESTTFYTLENADQSVSISLNRDNNN